MPARPGLVTPPPKRYKIAAFDYDGTLLASVNIYPYIHKEVLRELGVPECDLEYLTLGYWLDNVNTNKYHIDAPALFIERHNLADVVTPLRFREMRNQIEMEYFAGERELEGVEPELSAYIIKPVIDDLKRMQAEGTRCYVVSNNYGRVIDSALQQLGIRNLFEDIYSDCEYESLMNVRYDKNQPKAATYMELIGMTEDMGGNAGDCVVYDDLTKYIEQARTLGMDAVLVDSEHAVAPPKEHM